MLGKFLGRVQKSALPKNQIEVVCPVCGAAQIEPRLVVTTHCRKCREHLRIENGKVYASSHLNPVPSSVFPAVLDSHPTAGVTKEVDQAAPLFTPDPAPVELPPPTALIPTAALPPEELPLGLGNMMLGLKEPEERRPKPAAAVTAPAPAAPVPKPNVIERLRKSAPVRPPAPPPPTQGPLPAGTLQKMKAQGYYQQQYFKEVECFDCSHKFKVGRSAKSTSCPSCGAYICMEDIDINVASNAAIRTRGDVLIRKNGNVNTSEIRCRDLKVQGMVTAQIECSGDLTMRTTGTVIGEIRCQNFIVEKGSDIHFLNTIHASDVDIQARIEGSIHCTGRVSIGAQGWVHGDVTARSVSIEPGGHLDGAMNILRASPSKPLPMSQTSAPSASDSGSNGNHRNG